MVDTATPIAPTIPDVKPLSFDGDMTLVERDRTLFVAEDPDGTYHQYDPGTDEFVEREPITAEFLREVAANSDPKTGRIVAQGDTDYSAQIAIGHEDNKRFLHAANLPSAGEVKQVRYDEDSGKLSVRVQMPKQVADWVDAGLFPKVSARFYENWPKTGGGSLGPALGHVAALGTMNPVAKNLGPWSAALFSDNAEKAIANAKAAGLRVFNMAEGDLVLDFSEHTPEDIRTRIVEKTMADAEVTLDFIVQDIAATSGVAPEEIARFLAGETDELADAAMKSLMRFAGIPTMELTTGDGDGDDDEGDDGGKPAAAADGNTGHDDDDDEDDDDDDEKERDMAEATKTKAKKAKAKAKTPAAPLTIKDYAENQRKMQAQINDLTFTVGSQRKAAKRADDKTSKLEAVNAEQARLGRRERCLAFAELQHTTGHYPGPGNKKLIVDYLTAVGPDGIRARDFAEKEETDELQRAMDFIDKIKPEPVDMSGKFVSAGGAGQVAIDFAELDTVHAEFLDYKAECKRNKQPTDLEFRQFAEADGHDAETVEDFCREKKIKHPKVLESNTDK